VHPGNESGLSGSHGRCARHVRRPFTTRIALWLASTSDRCSWWARRARRGLRRQDEYGRVDYEYRRNRMGNVFIAIEPLAGSRHVELTERRTALDFTEQMRWLVDHAYPDAQISRDVGSRDGRPERRRPES
jgi:hypothetical protein